jgi:hypothetical protein
MYTTADLLHISDIARYKSEIINEGRRRNQAVDARHP